MTGFRFVVFLAVVLTIWAAMHLYVFWRAATVPWVVDHLPRRVLVVAAIALWSLYPVARILDSLGLPVVASAIEVVGACWIGVLFLLFSATFLADLVTLGGTIMHGFAPRVRGWALVVAAILALFGLVQAQRRPVLREYEVRLAGLPRERDGLVLVQVSDCHLGTLIGRRWLEKLVNRVNELRPDVVAVVGDVVDGNVGRVESLKPLLRQLRAPLGVWAVTGNHEYYAGLERSIALFEDAGFSVLRDRSAQVAPGLVFAGVDDLTARRQFGERGDPVERALANRPAGATILLSHSPLKAETAARHGAGLMLSGHTHEGQIWPFKYLVALTYPLVGGRYDVAGMPVIVCRGTGTWGPRMRLWRPSELLRITLRSEDTQPQESAAGT